MNELAANYLVLMTTMIFHATLILVKSFPSTPQDIPFKKKKGGGAAVVKLGLGYSKCLSHF